MGGAGARSGRLQPGCTGWAELSPVSLKPGLWSLELLLGTQGLGVRVRLRECGQDKVAIQQRVLDGKDGWPGQVTGPGMVKSLLLLTPQSPPLPVPRLGLTCPGHRSEC